MAEMNDIALLREYLDRDSETAFAGLVQRHVNLVYSVALRYTGNSHDTQDVTQAVFVILAKKAASLRHRTNLTGWLYETARFTSRQLLRTRARQQAREQEAYMQSTLNSSETESIWRQLAPLLEEAMSRLSEKERTLLALRFFENKNGAETAALMGINEWAARKRIDRAMEKLQKFLSARGIDSTTAAITGAISANSVQAAPVALANTATAVALVKCATVSTSTLTLVKGALKIVAWTKVKTAIVSVAILSLATVSVLQQQTQVKLREQNETLRQQQMSLAAQIRQLQKEHDDATNQLAGLLAENAQLKSNSNGHELLKLRGEVTQLKTAEKRTKSDPLEAAANARVAKVNQLKQRLEQMPNERIPELQYLTAQDWLRGATYGGDLKTDDDLDRALSQLRRDAKRKFAYSIGEALADYIAGNNGQLPGDISQLTPYFNPPIDGTILQRYQLLQTGNLRDIPKDEPLIAEKTPIDDRYDTLFKISATGFSYQGTGISWVNGSGKGGFGTNITAKIKPFERQ